MIRDAANATGKFKIANADMKRWYKTYYDTIKEFHDKKPKHICHDPSKLINLLDELENQIGKVVFQVIAYYNLDFLF